jgi:hypothetical protein
MQGQDATREVRDLLPSGEEVAADLRATPDDGRRARKALVYLVQRELAAGVSFKDLVRELAWCHR